MVHLHSKQDKLCFKFLAESMEVCGQGLIPATLSFLNQKPTQDISLLVIFQLSHIVLYSYQSVECACVCACIVMRETLSIYINFFDNIFHLDVHYVCLFSALSCKVGALQISIIIITQYGERSVFSSSD